LESNGDGQIPFIKRLSYGGKKEDDLKDRGEADTVPIYWTAPRRKDCWCSWTRAADCPYAAQGLDTKEEILTLE
jgi:hypothetical protein